MNGSGSFYAIQSARVINNYGTGTWSGTSDIRMYGGSSFNNQAGGTFTIQNNIPIGGGGPGYFNNLGTLTKSSSGDTQIDGNFVAFSNNGTVQIDSGRLLLGSGSSTGTFDVAQGATLAICGCGTQLFQSSSLIEGTGTFDSVGSVDTYISGTFTLPNLALSSGYVHFDSVGANTASTVMTLTQTSGELMGSRTISVTNVLDRPSGLSYMDGSGHTDILPSA
jgi:hypothetical protein